jgi:nitroreductase
MMETLEAIFTRRSIRKFTGQEVPETIVETLLKAAMYAPSAKNEQPWHFVVIRRRATLDEIQKFHPYSKMLAQAQLAILVCGDEKQEKSPGYWVIDCAAATENILLAAHGLGLGAVWLGIHPRLERVDLIIKLFDLPVHIHPHSMVALGWPAEIPSQPERFLPERIHHEKW